MVVLLKIHTFFITYTRVLLRHIQLLIHMRNLTPVLLVESHSPSLGTLKREMTHSGKKLQTCDICGKSLARSNYLKVHKKTPTGEKT